MNIQLGLVLVFVASCSSPQFHVDDAERARFLAAGPVTPKFDAQALISSLDIPLQYRLGPGDLLAIEFPVADLSAGGSGPAGVSSTTLRRRVSQKGDIRLPVIGEVSLHDMSLEEAENTIELACHPRFLKQRPSVIVEVVEGHPYPVTVLGTVASPGRHLLERNRLTLTDALAAAGGISAGDGEFAVGARGVVIYRPGQSVGEEVLLPVRHLNVPTVEYALNGGERIEVIRYEPKTFAVLGLVQRPGIFNFPVESSVSLLEAISQANGVDPVSAPPYATIFREDPDTEEILAVTFDLRKPLSIAKLDLSPGDIVHVDHTPGTWARQFLNRALQIRVGGQVNVLD